MKTKKKKYVPKAWRCECGKRKQRKSYINCRDCGRNAATSGPCLGFTL